MWVENGAIPRRENKSNIDIDVNAGDYDDNDDYGYYCDEDYDDNNNIL